MVTNRFKTRSEFLRSPGFIAGRAQPLVFPSLSFSPHSFTLSAIVDASDGFTARSFVSSWASLNIHLTTPNLAGRYVAVTIKMEFGQRWRIIHAEYWRLFTHGSASFRQLINQLSVRQLSALFACPVFTNFNWWQSPHYYHPEYPLASVRSIQLRILNSNFTHEVTSASGQSSTEAQRQVLTPDIKYRAFACKSKRSWTRKSAWNCLRASTRESGLIR